MIDAIKYAGITLLASSVMALVASYLSIESSERQKHGIRSPLALLWVLAKRIYWDERISSIMDCDDKFIIYLLTQYQACGRRLKPKDLEFISAFHGNIDIRNAAIKVLISNYGAERNRIIRRIIKRQLGQKNTPKGILSNYDYYEEVLQSQESGI
jgi:hypothetical protein